MTSRDEPTSLADEMSRQERSRGVAIVLFMMGLTFWDTLNPFFYDESNFWGYFESVLRAGQTRFAEELSRGHEHTS